MAHEDWYYKYGDHMPDGTPDTRWQTAPSRWLNRGHDAAANILVGAMEGGKAIKDFVGNTTFNPLPYGDIANSAYEGIQNIYGNWLDDKYDAVADWYNPQPDMIAEGPLSRAPANFRSAANLGLTPAIKHPDSNDWYWNMDQEPVPYHERVEYYDDYGDIPSHEIPGYDRMVNEGYDSWSPSDAIHNTWTDSNTDGYQPYSEMTQDEKDLDQKEHRQRIDTGLGTLYPGEAAARYYDSMSGMAGGPMSRNSGNVAQQKMFAKHAIEQDKYLEDYRRYANDPDGQREGMASGAYKAWSNQLGRGLITGNMIGEDMNRAGRIHPELKADWDAEMADTRDYRWDYQPWKADNRSDWQKWKDSVSGGRR